MHEFGLVKDRREQVALLISKQIRLTIRQESYYAIGLRNLVTERKNVLPDKNLAEQRKEGVYVKCEGLRGGNRLVKLFNHKNA